LNYSEKETLILTDDLLIGVGSERKCYLHPEDKEKCVKIAYKFGPRTKARCKREIKYSLKYSNLPESFSSLPKYFGKVNTNLDIGHVFELVLDYDGNISSKLSEYIKKNELNKALQDKISELYDSFIQYRVIVSDFHQGNIVVKKKNPKDFELVVIDGYGNSDFLKFADHISFFREKKLSRKFNRLLSSLHFLP
jgi:hypothetical protein